MGAMLDDHEARLKKLEFRSEYSTIDVNQAALDLAIKAVRGEFTEDPKITVERARLFAGFIWEYAEPETAKSADDA